MQRALIIGLATLALSLGCSSNRGGSRPQTAAREQYLILRDELESTNRDNLYDAVLQLRPRWFARVERQTAGNDALLVYVDDRQLGDVTTLRRFSARSVVSVRYLGPTEAQVRYGQINNGRPAILLESARGAP